MFCAELCGKENEGLRMSHDVYQAIQERTDGRSRVHAEMKKKSEGGS